MHRAAALLLLIALPMSAAPVHAAEAAVAGVDAATTDAVALASLVVPVDTIIAAARDKWGAELAERFAQDERAVALDAERPGLRDAYIAGGLDEVTTTYRDALLKLRADAERVYAATLTAAEIAELLAFFRTPTGIKLVAAMHAGVTASDGPDADAMPQNGKAPVAARIGESDWPALEAFSKTAAFAKTREVSQLIAQLSGATIAANTEKLAKSVPAATDRAVWNWRNAKERM